MTESDLIRLSGSTNSHDPAGFSDAMRELADDFLADRFWGRVTLQMKDILGKFDAGIAEELLCWGPTNPSLVRFVRYCIPLFEMHRHKDKIEPDPRWMAAMYLWQEAWRPLDNLVDDDGDRRSDIFEYSVSLLRAHRFHSSLIDSSAAMTHYLECLNQTLSSEQKLQSIQRADEIFLRAKVFETSFKNMEKLSNETINSYRRYINTLGISHDFADVVDDVKSGIETFATRYLISIDPYCRINYSNYKRLLAFCMESFDGERSKIGEGVEASCWVTKRNIECFQSWAFSN